MRFSSQLQSIQPSQWPRPRLEALLGAMRGKKILVIGDLGVDRYTIGTVERISPEAPVPIVQVQSEQLKLGLAANVAENVQALGGNPYLVGVVGRDSGAVDFKKLLKAVPIRGTHLVSDPSRRTVLKDRVVSDRQQLLRIDFESLHPIGSKVEAQILGKVEALLPKVDAVIIEDYAKGLLSQRLCRKIFGLAKTARKLVAVDPNSKTLMRFYSGASVLTPNTKEAESLTGLKIQDKKSLIRVGNQVLQATGARYVVVTRGKEGMAIFGSAGEPVTLIPTYAREVYDVSGAGDTVISVLTLALASGASIQDAAILANLAAGVEVGKRGTATVSGEEILAALKFFCEF
ncbi:D-glycero-beta-D-manno-heptose-7-phosphate kinase [Bdellovibrionota bacterium FG-1]